MVTFPDLWRILCLHVGGAVLTACHHWLQFAQLISNVNPQILETVNLWCLWFRMHLGLYKLLQQHPVLLHLPLLFVFCLHQSLPGLWPFSDVPDRRRKCKWFDISLCFTWWVWQGSRTIWTEGGESIWVWGTEPENDNVKGLSWDQMKITWKKHLLYFHSASTFSHTRR